MTAIRPYLRDAVFDQKDISAMSMALDDVCKALNILDAGSYRRAHHRPGAGRRAQPYAVARQGASGSGPSPCCPRESRHRWGRDETSRSLAGPLTSRSGPRAYIPSYGDDMTQVPKLSYRVVKASPGWCWEVRNGRRDVLASGRETTNVKARAKAILAAISIDDAHVKNDPTNLIEHREMTRRRRT
jgi:hypothetical protein